MSNVDGSRRPTRRVLGLHPETWAGLSPNGVGQQKPNHIAEMAKVAWQVRVHPRKAWKILSEGVCDGCALGVAGFHDWTIDGIHLCTTRLSLLDVNVADPFDPTLLADVTPLLGRSGAELRELGRLGHPMRRRRGERGFTRISWDEALSAVGAAMRSAGPERTAWYLTSRGLTNETYYAAAKAARVLGIANIDSAARVCHAPSTVGLKGTIGVAASTCSLQDVIDSDLVVLWGTNPANNQPVFMKYLDRAVKAGTKVVVVNPFLEPGLERYWVPSAAESAVFGTKICALHVPVRPGGDVALVTAVLMRLIEQGQIDEAFVAEHTEGWEELCAHLETLSYPDVVAASGLTPAQVDEFASLYGSANRAVIVWSMGITQHRDGVAGVQAIVNLALARGNVGRTGAGLMPIRGHSGVQGGAEMGAYATAMPGGVPVDAEQAVRFEKLWGVPVPSSSGLMAPEMVDAAGRGGLDVLWCSGGNLTEVLPDPDTVATALERVPLRVHADIVLTSQMFVPGDDVILLPVATRYEQEGGGTSTTTERRVAFSPEILRPPAEARSEWRLYGDVVAATAPDLAHTMDWTDNQALRREIAEVVPSYAGIETLAATGDAVQWGGRHLCADGRFPTPSGRGRFSVLDPGTAPTRSGPDEFRVSTRRGKQFNTMIWAATDPLTGAGRDAVLLDAADAAALGLREGDRVRLDSGAGSMEGRARVVSLPTGTAQVHWPEGNVLLPGGSRHRDPRSGIFDDHVVVRVTRLGDQARSVGWPT